MFGQVRAKCYYNEPYKSAFMIKKNAYKIGDLFIMAIRILWLLLLANFDWAFYDLFTRSCNMCYSLRF